jgi:hypothetical protein
MPAEPQSGTDTRTKQGRDRTDNPSDGMKRVGGGGGMKSNTRRPERAPQCWRVTASVWAGVHQYPTLFGGQAERGAISYVVATSIE